MPKSSAVAWGGERRVEMQEQQPEAQRQRQHDADGNVALAELLAEQPHADAGRRR
ncbi:MAG: hypothetical protein WDM84_02945 [Bauldia sp.]